MREGWTETTIGAVTEVNPETTTGWSPDTSFRYIDLSSVSADRGIDEAGLPTVALVNAPRRARRVVRRGDVIVATVRPYLRGFAQVPTSLDGEVASTGFCVLRAVNQVVESRYIWAAVRCYRRNSLRTTVVFSARIFADRVDSAASLKTA
jgi:type I restriction enzyme S subunit